MHGLSDKDIRIEFSKLINLENSRICLSPHIVFICGGQVDVQLQTNHSVRNMFMNLSSLEGEETDGFVLAETYKDWGKAYESLADFENDVAYISSLIIVFLESPGALTEFGLFFSNLNLRDKLVVIVHDDYHEQESFIKYGLLNPLEEKNESSVLVYPINHNDIENVASQEVEGILKDVLELCQKEDQTRAFKLDNRGHQIFLIYQLIDLFYALTTNEIKEYITILGIDYNRKKLNSALYILKEFDLVNCKKKGNQTFYYIKRTEYKRVDFHFNSLPDKRRYDTNTIKIEVMDFYKNLSKTDRKHSRRISLIEHNIDN